MTGTVRFRVADEAGRRAAVALVGAQFAAIGHPGEGPPRDAHVLVAEVDGQVVATVSLVIEGDVAHLVRLASRAGTTDALVGLFELAAGYGRSISDAAWLEIEVAEHHARFYSGRFGFATHGDPYRHRDGVVLQPMRIRADLAIQRLGRAAPQVRDPATPAWAA